MVPLSFPLPTLAFIFSWAMMNIASRSYEVEATSILRGTSSSRQQQQQTTRQIHHHNNRRRSLDSDIDENYLELILHEKMDKPKELGICEGPCKNDNDCIGALSCFKRNKNEDVPGCTGGTNDNSKSDYCTDMLTSSPSSGGDDENNPSNSPSEVPSLRPSTRPSNQPSKESREIYVYPNGRPPADAFPLGLCHGDCTDHTECGIGLYCFQRGPDEPIPGCIGGETDHSRTDYCVDIPPELWSSANPTESMSPNESPSVQPSISPSSSNIPTIELVPSISMMPSYSSNPTPGPGQLSIPNPKVYPLQQCEGDCLWPEDCDDGMFCFQRGPNEAVPGCIGGETDGSRTDYCTYSPPVVVPVEPPTADNFRIKMYWDNYYWQEEDFDREWCMQCSTDGCQEGEILFLHYCAWDSARFDFVDVNNNTDQIQIQVVDTDLCLQRSGNATSLEECNFSESLQHWNATNGTSFDGNFFEFSQNFDGEDYCVTTHHHPKYGEIIELYTCEEARFDTSSYWEKY